MTTGNALLRLWLRDNRNECRAKAARARRAYQGHHMGEAAERLAKAHEAAAQVYERALAAEGEEPAP